MNNYKQQYEDEDYNENEEIDFDQLLGDAVASQAEYDEDRDDFEFDTKDSDTNSL